MFLGRLLSKRKFSPPQPRPVRSEFPVRERNPFPGPAKKPRMESHVPYVAPEKRPYAKPVPRPAGPRVSNPQTVIENRPLVYNAPSKSVSELQPLPQRPKPVHKPQPKQAPPTQPLKPVEKQVPVKLAEKQMPFNTPVKQLSVKPAGKQVPVNPVGKQVPVNPAGKQVPVNPAGKQVPVNPAGKQVPVNPAGKQLLVNPAGKQVPVKPTEKQLPVNPTGKQVPVNPTGKQVPVNPTGKQVPVNPTGKQVPVNPTGKQVPVKPTQKQVPVNPTGKQVPVNPTGKQVLVNPTGKPVPVNPTGKQVPVNPTDKQVPVQPAVKQTPVKAEENLEPAKNVQKQPAKPVQAQEVQPAQKENAVELTVDGNSLNALTSRVLADEIQDIMDKVAEELPEAPEKRADKLVVERFRTIIGDDIRNALGLNVTTRILDMHNPLYVKLVFSGKPEAGCLQAFIARHAIGAFKRIAAPGDTFAARLDSVRAFDRLCGEKKLLCGTASVTVTPCYKFLACPSEVKSIYAVNNEVNTEKIGNNDSTSSDQTLTPSKDTDKNAENTVDNNAEATADQKITVKVEGIKIKEEVDDTLEETRPVTPVKNRKPTPVKVNIIIEAATKSDVKKSSPSSIKLEITDEITKDVDNNLKIKEELLEEAENSGSKKVKSENNVDDKTSIETNISSVCLVDKQVADDGELSDRDILAFISGGIVLDECSGSEDEK